MLETGEIEEGADHEADDGAIGPEDLGRFVVTRTCEACGGRRLRPEALAVRLGDKNIAELSTMPLRPLQRFLAALGESQRTASARSRDRRAA